MRLLFRLFLLCLFIQSGIAADDGSTAPAPATAPSSAPNVVTEPPAVMNTADASDSKERPSLDPKIKVTKVHIVDNTEAYKDGGNDALQFERKYWNYGAATEEEKEARRGQIYVISWRNKGTPQDLTARFEYRQIKSRDAVFVKSLEFPAASGTNRAIFQIVGDEYRKNGAVYSWRFTVLRGAQVVAVETSYIW